MLVGGAPSSQHVEGEAADCVAENGAGVLPQLLLLSELPFDQAILYPKPAAGWRWWIWVGGAVVLALAVKYNRMEINVWFPSLAY
ncbi:MAG: hypothetical protein LBQ78_04040 [Tannerellaceae bacterium]|jgi:hypothetical protein|nr:hypothetical protein [Tannerellaceae bacterium]